MSCWFTLIEKMIRKGYYSNGLGWRTIPTTRILSVLGCRCSGLSILRLVTPLRFILIAMLKGRLRLYLIRLIKDGEEAYGYVTKPRTSGQRRDL